MHIGDLFTLGTTIYINNMQLKKRVKKVVSFDVHCI